MISMRRLAAGSEGSKSSGVARVAGDTLIAKAYTASEGALPGLEPISIAFAEMLAKLPGEHSWTHPEGWRDWPYETPATTVTSQREGANSREMCGGPSCSSPHR